MEVHHHPDIDHKRKKFKEYFLEFLMIFLAVTLGFFAEGLREHIGDREKEKQYIESLKEDLTEDTAAINQQMKINAYNLTRIDSLNALLLFDSLNQESILRAYKLFAYTADEEDVNFNDRTYLQLQSTGSIRLIKFPEIVNSIINYQRGIKNCRDQAAYYTKSSGDLLTESKNVFKAENIFRFRKAIVTYSDTGVSFNRYSADVFDSLAQKTKFTFISTDKKVFSSYCFMLDTYAMVVVAYMQMIKHQKKLAVNLLDLLHKKYD